MLPANEATGREPADGDSATWTTATEQLLHDWRNRAYAAQTGYYIMTERLRRWQYLLGVPAVILSSIVGTAIFATLENKQVGTVARVVLASTSILAATLSGLQTFMRFAERAGLHSTAAGLVLRNPARHRWATRTASPNAWPPEGVRSQRQKRDEQGRAELAGVKRAALDEPCATVRC